MKKGSVQTLTAILFAAGFGLGMAGFTQAEEKWLSDPVPVLLTADETTENSAEASTEAAAETTADAAEAASTENTITAPANSSQSYQVVIESKIGSDGKRVQTKKVWKDGVLVEDEEKTVEGADADGETAIELDGQIAPGIVLRSERNGMFPFGTVDPNLANDEMVQQMRQQMEQIRKRQEEMMRQFGFGPSAVWNDSTAPAEDADALPLETDANGFPASFKPSEYWLGAQVEPIAEPVRNQLGLAADEGIWILAVVPGSPAEKAGLQKFDILVKLGDQVIGNQAQVGELLDANGEQPISIEFIRQGARTTAELIPEKRPQAEAVTDAVADPNGIFAPNEKIRVVRPGMIIPANTAENADPAENTPAESAENTSADTPAAEPAAE